MFEVAEDGKIYITIINKAMDSQHPYKIDHGNTTLLSYSEKKLYGTS